MTRRRAGKKNKDFTMRNKFTIPAAIILFFVIVILISYFTIFNFNVDSTDDDDSSDDNGSDGKWLFAMDTDNVQYKYSASAIPTLVIIDDVGDVVYYNQGLHSKSQLLPHIESAIEGTTESLGESLDFTVTTFNNEEFTLSEHIGEVIILDIMGVGCPPCELQMPELQEIEIEKGKDIVILSIDVYFSGETEEDVIETYGEYIKL